MGAEPHALRNYRDRDDKNRNLRKEKRCCSPKLHGLSLRVANAAPHACFGRETALCRRLQRHLCALPRRVRARGVGFPLDWRRTRANVGNEGANVLGGKELGEKTSPVRLDGDAGSLHDGVDLVGLRNSWKR